MLYIAIFDYHLDLPVDWTKFIPMLDCAKFQANHQQKFRTSTGIICWSLELNTLMDAKWQWWHGIAVILQTQRAKPREGVYPMLKMITALSRGHCFTNVNIYIYVCMYMYMICIYIYTYVYIYMYTYVYIYTHVYIYIYIHVFCIYQWCVFSHKHNPLAVWHLETCQRTGFHRHWVTVPRQMGGKSAHSLPSSKLT